MEAAIATDIKGVKASVSDGVAKLRICCPSKRNALGALLRDELQRCLCGLAGEAEVKCIVLCAEGNTFCAGIDLMELTQLGNGGGQSASSHIDAGRAAMVLNKSIREFQEFITCFETCTKPIIAAVHGACIGAGVDLITACDIRLCSKAAVFSVREAKVGLAADVGTLQRLPKVVGCTSWVRDLAFTGRDVKADEALRFGLVQDVAETQQAVEAQALELARLIANNSPLAVAATKASLNFSRDHGVAEGLEHVRLLNQSYLQAPDVAISAKAFMQKTRPVYPSLPKLRSAL
mmetsp:Transcript_39154/g.92123  ORF Transcript_39154/g.92123 Transcript_39154/m.92123 type:complete len:291 (+) Transcript_39154:44-916(+)